MVVNIKVLGKAGAGIFLLRPRAIRLLTLDEEPHAPPHRWRRNLTTLDQCHHGPRGLRGRAAAAPLRLRIGVAIATFSPSAVRTLAALHPPDGALNIRLGKIFTEGPQARQHRPSAVDVIHTPAPIPRPILRLIPAQKA